MEQMIIFVYDTGFCQTEADDPQKAVLFFYPNWVSDQQRLALCGQLMGAAHFCSTMFSTPSVLSLQSGKFVLKKFGQYFLCVGSDQTLPEWILQERFSTLQFLLQFYHKDFDAMLSGGNLNHDECIKKISDILEIYIPVLQFVVSSFGNTPTIRFPKSKSTAFLEATQLLEACSSSTGVLGGVVLCHSRVLSTQFDSETTKLLALTDPFRIKLCAESMSTPFHLPVGVQILRVYVKQKTHDAICNASKECANNDNSTQKTAANDTIKNSEAKKIFTVHEDEVWDQSKQTQINKERSSRRIRAVKQFKPKTENNLLKERSKNFKTNPNISICSTPTVEKTFIHDELVSICSGKVEQRSVPTQPPANFIPDLVKDAIKAKQRNTVTKYSTNRLQRISMDDQMVDLTHKSFPIPMRCYSFGLPTMCKEVDSAALGDKTKKKSLRSRFYKTIADPMNPVFRYDGLPMSKSLYNHCLDEHYRDYIAANITIDSREEFIKSKNMENHAHRATPTKDLDTLSERLKPKEESAKVEVTRREKVTNSNQKLFRRSLTLPLKPLSFDSADNSSQQTAASAKSRVFHAITPSTPLMTKLSLLALEEQQLPNEQRAASVPSVETSKKKRNVVKNSPTNQKDGGDSTSETVPCGLFVCGHQNMTILLLLDDSAEQNPDLILYLWELASTNLDKIENTSNLSSDHVSSTAASNSYSFLSMDPSWGTMQRSGPWGNDELKIVGVLHQDMIRTANITEVVVRNEDSVVYGYRCGSSETFYQQGGCSSTGLPTPADLMGTVTLKARRRLERDHGVVLL